MDALVTLLREHGALIVFLVTLAARLGAPLPASPLLVVAGGLAAAGELSGVTAFVASMVANLAGEGVWFQAGRRYGHRVMKLLCRVSLSPDSCVRQSESIIGRWGGSSLIAAKFIPGVSVVAAPMAGALRMPTARFVAFQLLAGAIWAAFYLLLGAALSDQVQQILDAIADAGAIAGGALGLLLLGWVATRYWRRRSSLRDAAMPRISVDELGELMRQGKAPLIIDVRSDASAEIDPRRIPGALPVPLEQLRGKAASLPRDREIVTVCNCPNDVSAARAARSLVAQGHRRVRPLAGGFDAWAAYAPPAVAARSTATPPARRAPPRR